MTQRPREWPADIQLQTRKAAAASKCNYAGISDAQSQPEGAEASVQEFYDQTCGLFNTLYSLAQQQEEAVLMQFGTADDEQYTDSEGDSNGQEQDHQENE